MLTKKVEDILNVQVDKEGYSSHLYLSMAVWAETEGFGGVAEWLYAQAEEERMHMLKLVRYINERDGKAAIIALKEPPAAFGSVPEMFDKVLEHERFVTASINDGQEFFRSKNFKRKKAMTDVIKNTQRLIDDIYATVDRETVVQYVIGADHMRVRPGYVSFICPACGQ